MEFQGASSCSDFNIWFVQYGGDHGIFKFQIFIFEISFEFKISDHSRQNGIHLMIGQTPTCELARFSIFKDF